MTTMYSPGQYRKLEAERDELKAQRDELLVAAKKVIRHEVMVAADDFPKWQRVMFRLHRAIDKAEGRS